MFYYAGDGNWWLGDMANGQLGWSLVSQSAGFGNLIDGQHPVWLGDFTGSGHTQVMFHYSGDGNWWLGDMAGGQLGWSLRGNTAGDLVFTDAERAQVLAEVQDGLGQLAGFEPNANITWSYDVKIVGIRALPDPNLSGYEPLERLWRDPAMQAMGYGPGLGEVGRYIQDLRTSLNTDWTYCVFFTKYPCEHFAYASIGGPRIVMQYANDGWGPTNIDRVVAHETGHIFQAADEYASSGCGCGGSWGVNNEPNGNCENCAPGGGVACLMKANTYQLCDHTRRMFGWTVAGGPNVAERSVGDPRDFDRGPEGSRPEQEAEDHPTPTPADVRRNRRS